MNNKPKKLRAKSAPIPKREAERQANQTWRDQELLLRGEVEHLTRLSDTTIWRLEKQGLFPKRIRIGLKRVAWRSRAIADWLEGTWAAPDAV